MSIDVHITKTNCIDTNFIDLMNEVLTDEFVDFDLGCTYILKLSNAVLLYVIREVEKNIRRTNC